MDVFLTRDQVFVAGGQPTITYVERREDHIEKQFARAIAAPNQIVSLAGPTKTGKTVLCKKVLGTRQYVWIDGGQIKDGRNFWDAICAEISLPLEAEITEASESELALEGSVPLITTAKGSRLLSSARAERRIVATAANAIAHLLKNQIIVVIDDFHYIDPAVRSELMRNLKGAVFNGLKVVLLSVTHRVFDAIKAETELTGRFTAISLPHWSKEDLRKIAEKGFNALNVDYDDQLLVQLCNEAQESPFLMQKFCWEICFDCQIDSRALVRPHRVPRDYKLEGMLRGLAKDAGLPIYAKLAAGPQSRKSRAKRLMQNGERADIYEVILLALAQTGPKSAVSYDELRSALGTLLLPEAMPQKHEITSALKHLTRIAREIGAESAIDWDDSKREVNVAEPYLRFYLRWQIKKNGVTRVA